MAAHVNGADDDESQKERMQRDRKRSCLSDSRRNCSSHWKRLRMAAVSYFSSQLSSLLDESHKRNVSGDS